MNGYDFGVAQPTAIAELSPAAGEEMVSLTRETIVRFDTEVDPATITDQSFYLLANSQRVPGHIRVSSTNRFATFFYDDPLPASTAVRVVVNGNLIVGQDGLPVDADNDSEPGGILNADFRTLPITLIPNTRIFGYIYDSYNRNPDGSNIPVAGATISLDARPDIKAVTNAAGFFELGIQDVNGDTILDGLPAPEFFVHIDGSTATNAPAGAAYATLGKPFHTIPGQRVQLEMAGGPDVDSNTPGDQFHIYLPPMSMGDVIELNPNDAVFNPETGITGIDVGFGPDAQAQIRRMMSERYPNDPEKAAEQAQLIIDTMQVTYPVGSAQNEDGTLANRAMIVPVDPARLPAPLPPGVDPGLVISIQAGIGNQFNATGESMLFDRPAPVTFPNLNNYPASTQILIHSFDHDAGKWISIGTGTVTENGRAIISDPNTGILAPGWHYISNFVNDIGCFGEDCPCPPTDPDCERVKFSYGASFSVTLQPIEIDARAFLVDPPNNVPPVGIRQAKPFGPKEPIPYSDGITGEFWVKSSYADYLRPFTFSGEVGAEFRGTIEFGGASGEAGVTGRKGDSFLVIEGLSINIGLSASAEFRIVGPPCAIPGFGAAICRTFSADIGVSTLLSALERLVFGDGIIPLGAALTDDYDGSLRVDLATVQFQFAVDATASAFFVEGNGPNGITPLSSLTESEDQVTTTYRKSSLFAIGNSDTVYYRYIIDGESAAHGKSTVGSNVVHALPAGRDYELRTYQPGTNTVGKFFGVTGVSGASTISNPVLSNVGGIDSDLDGIPDEGEEVIGTDPLSSDTDHDGVSDVAEIEQGLDPLGGRSFPTGIIASLALPGETRSVELTQGVGAASRLTGFAATGSHGLAVFDSSNFQNPTILGQIDLNGTATDVAVDSLSSTAIVATGEGGLQFIDVRDAMMPKLVRTASVNTTQVELLDGLAYAPVGGRLTSYDPVSGDLVASYIVPDAGAIIGLTHEAKFLYAMDVDRFLHVVEVTNQQMTKRGSVQLPQGGGGMSVDNGVVYVGAQPSYLSGGFVTVDVSNPTNPSIISGSDLIDPFIAPGQAIVPNGSGLGLAVGLVGRAANQPVVSIANLSDPAVTNNYSTQFNLPARPHSVAIASGIGYVADGTAGVVVVNYVSFDNQGTAPTVSAIGPSGSNLQEGSIVSIRPTVTDDVQVRNVELLMNGAVVANDVSAPWDLRSVVPALSTGDTSVRFQVRATDTGGNVGLSNELIYTLTADVTSPSLTTSTPAEGSAGFKVQAISLRFNEPIDGARLSVAGLTLTHLGANAIVGGGDDTVATIDRIEQLSPQRVVVYTSQPLPEGRYRLLASTNIIADMAGNSPASDLSLTFTSFDLDEQNSIAWVSNTDGDWNNPGNWSSGQVPGPNDAVIIDNKTTNVRVRLPSGNVTVRSLISREEFIMTGGSLTITQASEIQGRFEIGNGSTLTVDGQNALFVANGDTKIDGASFEARNGGQIHLPSAMNYTHTVGAQINRDNVRFRATGTGSVLNLRNVGTLTGGADDHDHVIIEALSGGRIDLSGVTDIIDPNAGNIAEGRAIEIKAESSGIVDLSSLRTFIDRDQTGHHTAGLSVINAKTGGTIKTSLSGPIVENVDVLLMSGGEIQGSLQVGTNSFLTGSDGKITGNVINRNIVRPGSAVGVLTIQGNFTQTPAGTLQIEIGGAGAGVSYDQLRVTGTATLDGTLALQVINGFNPAVNSVYSVVTYGTNVAQFALITGATPAAGKVWEPDYQNSSLSIVTTQPLLLGPGSTISVSETPVLTGAELTVIADEAKKRWIIAGYTGAALNSVNFRITDLKNGLLGLAGNNTIWIDINASGIGWFIDPTASKDEEFLLYNTTLSALENRAAASRIDLLSVLMHEMGHLIGLDDHHGSCAASIMNDSLAVGTRILLSPLDLDDLFSDANLLDQL